MKKDYLRKGDFVRTKTREGLSLIGGLLMVDDLEGEMAYVHHVPENGIGSFSRLKSRLKKLNAIHLQLSKEDAEDLVKRRPDRFSRKSTPKWENAIEKDNFDIAVFSCISAGIEIVVEKPHFWNPYKLTHFRPETHRVACRWERMIIIK